MTIKAIQARFTSGNDIPVQKAMVPADEWHMAMAEIQVLKDEIIWKLSEVSQLQEQNTYLDKLASDAISTNDRQAMMLGEQEKVIEKLRKENEELLGIFKVKHHAALRFFEKEAALEAEIERLRKDAARYQWLRQGDNDEVVAKEDCRGPYLPRNEHLDAAIDAAMESR